MKGYNIERFRNGFLIVRSDYVVTLGGGGGGGGGSSPKEAFFLNNASELGAWLAKDLGAASEGGQA